MKKMIYVGLTSMLVFAAFCLSAQPPPPPPPQNSTGPIDSGAVVLLIVVAAYGYFRLKQKEKPALS
jgi:hypothetical protein